MLLGYILTNLNYYSENCHRIPSMKYNPLQNLYYLVSNVWLCRMENIFVIVPESKPIKEVKLVFPYANILNVNYFSFYRLMLMKIPPKNGVVHNRLWFWIQVIDMLIDLLTLNLYSTTDTERQIAIIMKNSE